MFAPIQKTSDLPAARSTNERRFIDFKRAGSQYDRYEIAKDVAAFANAEGGTILVGASGKGEYLDRYEPMGSRDASGAQRSYDEAIRDRCSPSPIFDVVSIAVDDGFVLAVNVWPFPGQPIGVEVKKGEARCGESKSEPEGLFYFPLRIGAHTTSITPEQLPMFVEARIRRIAICLQQAVGQQVLLSAPRQADGPGSQAWIGAGKLEAVDILGNSIVLAMPHEHRSFPVSVPFDLIHSAWREGPDWLAIIRGRIEPRVMHGIPERNGNPLVFLANA